MEIAGFAHQYSALRARDAPLMWDKIIPDHAYEKGTADRADPAH
jgi:hypothetical protein